MKKIITLQYIMLLNILILLQEEPLLHRDCISFIKKWHFKKYIFLSVNYAIHCAHLKIMKSKFTSKRNQKSHIKFFIKLKKQENVRYVIVKGVKAVSWNSTMINFQKKDR